MTEDRSSKKYVPLIKEVSIDNFKGIKQCEIKNLRKVNLFIGKNGSGKSTIMEAIYFTGKEFLGHNLAQCIKRRATRSIWSARELWYQYNMSSDIHVKLTFNEEDFADMGMIFSDKDKKISVYLGGGTKNSAGKSLVWEYRPANFSVGAVHRDPLRASFLQTGHNEQIRQYFDHSVFIDPTIKRNVNQIETKYLNIVERSKKNRQDLVKRISGIYDTDPIWSFLPHEDFEPTEPSRFTIFEGGQRLFLDNFGDGLHYGLAVLAIAKTRNNTALFIEEIESHQHPEAIKNLITNLLDIAITNNVQLFITTHNQDVWRYLHYNYANPEERKKEFQCFRVTKDEDTGIVKAIIEEGLANIQPELHGEP